MFPASCLTSVATPEIESSLIKIQKRVNLKLMKTFEINPSPK
jgi:hypothetical protein